MPLLAKGLLSPSARQPRAASSEREMNIAFANDLLETEIAQRNSRKDAQENTARGVILSSGLVLTLLLGLAKDAGLFSPGASAIARFALAATVIAGGIGAACAIGTLWPRRYDQLGAKGLAYFNDPSFLDQASHQVTGTLVATRIGIAQTMDALHEQKSRWLKWSFRMLSVAFLGLIVQGGALAIDPPDTAPSNQPNPIVINHTTTP